MGVIEIILQDYTLRIVALGSGLLGIVSGAIGSFAVIRKQGLLGDAISHAALPGIAIAFLLLQTKNTEYFLIGALISGLVAAWLISIISNYSRIKIDSSMALILSVFFGVGLVLLTFIQKIPNANQAGLESFIFGQASTLLRRDIAIVGLVGIVLLLLIMLFWKEFKLFSFDSDYADILGFSSKKLSLLLSSMIVVSIIIGLQTVGVILMSAMLIAPGVAARQWTNKLSVMVVLASIFGAASGIIGTFISSSMGRMPTGPSIIIVVSVIVLISIALAPRRGLIWQYFRNKKRSKLIYEDQVLIELYDLRNEVKNTKRIRENSMLKNILISLGGKGLAVEQGYNEWAITESGILYVEQHPMKRNDYHVTTS